MFEDILNSDSFALHCVIHMYDFETCTLFLIFKNTFILYSVLPVSNASVIRYIVSGLAKPTTGYCLRH